MCSFCVFLILLLLYLRHNIYFEKQSPFFQVQIPLFQNDTTRPMAQMIASMSGAMVNLLFIMLLGRVYENLALRLTTWGKLSSFILFENRGSGSFIPMQGRWNCNAPPDFRPTGCRLDVLWGQPIKHAKVASTLELCENQQNDLLFFEIVPCYI